MTAEDPTYLGDGLYARTNQVGQIEVYAYNGRDKTAIVYFEPQTYMNFHSWVKARHPQLEKTR